MPLVDGVLPDPVIYLIAWVWCYAWLSYCNISFFLLSLENSHAVYSSMYYIGHIIIIVSIPLLSFILSTKKANKTEKKKEVKVE